MNYIVCRIHNHSLGVCLSVDSWVHGIEIIEDWCKEQDFELSPKELVHIVETGEYYNDDDMDNIFTFSIGVVEEI